MSFSPLSSHQTVVKTRVSRLNFYEGPIPVSEFVNCPERGKLGVEISQRRASAGSTCLYIVGVVWMMFCDTSKTDCWVTPLGRTEVLETLRSRSVSFFRTRFNSDNTDSKVKRDTFNLALM
jgi:hypothetical protein